MMKVPDHWGVELAGFKALLVGPVRELGEGWSEADGRYEHQYRATIATTTDRFSALEQAATNAGVRAERSRVGLRLTGSGWTAVGRALVTELDGQPLAYGTSVELIALAPSDAARVQHGANELSRRLPAFAPFADLAERHGARFKAAFRFEFEDRTFGYIELHREGWGPFLRSNLEAWLGERGFSRTEEPDGWRSSDGARLIVIARESDLDELRIDVEGLMAYRMRPASALKS